MDAEEGKCLDVDRNVYYEPGLSYIVGTLNASVNRRRTMSSQEL